MVKKKTNFWKMSSYASTSVDVSHIIFLAYFHATEFANLQVKGFLTHANICIYICIYGYAGLQR